MGVLWKRRVGLSLMLLAGLALCLPFIHNTLFFDDMYLFQPGKPEKFLADGVHFYPRWWVLETFAATYVGLGSKLLWLRLGNLLLHLAVVLALACLLRNLLRDLDRRVDLPLSADVAATLAAGFFVVHPLAVFTQGYLIQFTILCATLFSLLSLLAFWRGLSGSRLALWGSCLLFALAVYAKEHAIMLPLAAFLLLLLRRRSTLSVGLPSRSVLSALLVQCVLALLVFLQLKGLVGTPYEMLTAEVLEGEPEIARERLYPLSVLNQAGAFFKYLGLWFLPAPNWLSVDIRQAFPLDFSSWRLWGGAVAFVSYLAGGLVLLLRGGACGLLGLSLLLPGVLFFTEFAAVRLQEPFVLYRSYLWAPFLFIAVALGLRRSRVRVLAVVLLLFVPIFAALSYQRLKTFSHPVLVWREAADVYEANPQQAGVFGGYRIYYNLGTELRELGYLQPALDALNRAQELKSTFGWTWNNRGAVFLDMQKYPEAQADYEQAVQLMPKESMPWRGLAKALEAQGKHREADQARQKACVLNRQSGCGQMKPVDLLRHD